MMAGGDSVTIKENRVSQEIRAPEGGLGWDVSSALD